MADDSTTAALVLQFAANLRTAREALPGHVSQEALADLCSMHRTEIQRLESGKREPRLSTIIKIADGLDIDPAILIEGMRNKQHRRRTP